MVSPSRTYSRLLEVGEFLLAATSSYARLREVMQRRVSDYFGTPISITPKALHALACPRLRYPNKAEYHCGRFDEELVFDRLVLTSPNLFTKLQSAGLKGLHAMTTFQQSGFPVLTLLPMIFNEAPTARVVKESGKLSSHLLYRCLLEEAMLRPYSWLGKKLRGSLGIPANDEAAFARFITEATTITSEDEDSLGVGKDQFSFLLELDIQNRLKVHPYGDTARIMVADASQESPFSATQGILMPPLASSDILNEATICLFEELINRNTKEHDYQDFFEDHPEFFQAVGYEAAYPQLSLTDLSSNEMIPDFFLKPSSTSFLDILEIKRPNARLITSRHDGRRVRFSSHVHEAVAQLLEYKRYFEIKEHREIFCRRYHLRVFRPKIVLLIGRDSAFDRVRHPKILRDELPHDFEILTFDGLAQRAHNYVRYVKENNAWLV